MSRSNQSPFSVFSLKMKKKQEAFKRQICSMIDDMFDFMNKEFVRVSSTLHSPSEPVSSSRNAEDKVVGSDSPSNSLATRKSAKTCDSSGSLNLNSKVKQPSTYKRKSTIKNNTGKVKRYRIEPRCKIQTDLLKRMCSSSSSSDSIQEKRCSSTKSKVFGKGSQKKQCTSTVDMPTDSDSCHVSSHVETGVSESIFFTEMELNQAMLGVFFDGNSYFVCDVQQYGSINNNNTFYKVYNVHITRLHEKKPFASFSEFQHHFIKPDKFDTSIAINTRVLVLWSLNDTELTPATIKDVFFDYKQVQVQNNKGEGAVISIYDVFILPNYMPIMSDASDASDASISTTESAQTKMFRDKPLMDEVYNRYAQNKQKYADDKSYLEGIWRWADKVESGSLIEPDDNKLVNANSFRSIYKNNRIKFSLNDDVVIWDSTEKGAYKYPIIGIIHRLYENIATKQKRIQFKWYLHPAEYPDSGLKPLNVSIYLTI